MFQRRIGVAEVRAIVENGQVIEDRPDDLPGRDDELLHTGVHVPGLGFARR